MRRPNAASRIERHAAIINLAPHPARVPEHLLQQTFRELALDFERSGDAEKALASAQESLAICEVLASGSDPREKRRWKDSLNAQVALAALAARQGNISLGRETATQAVTEAEAFLTQFPEKPENAVHDLLEAARNLAAPVETLNFSTK